MLGVNVGAIVQEQTSRFLAIREEIAKDDIPPDLDQTGCPLSPLAIGLLPRKGAKMFRTWLWTTKGDFQTSFFLLLGLPGLQG